MNRFICFLCGTIGGVLSRFFVVFLIFFAADSLYGQEQDFRSWWSVDLTKDLTKNLQAELELGQRFQDNSLGYERSLVTASLEYELFNNFDIAGGYRYIVYRDRGIFDTKYRVHGDISYQYSISSFSFQLRERIQYGFQDFSTIENYSSNNLTSRTRVRARYDIFGSPLRLFTSYKLFLGLNTSSGVQARDHRIQAGTSYKLSMRSDIEVGYLFNAEANRSNPLNAHVLVVAYSYRL
jgi:hypothetical protein